MTPKNPSKKEIDPTIESLRRIASALKIGWADFLTIEDYEKAIIKKINVDSVANIQISSHLTEIAEIIEKNYSLRI